MSRRILVLMSQWKVGILKSSLQKFSSKRLPSFSLLNANSVWIFDDSELFRFLLKITCS